MKTPNVVDTGHLKEQATKIQNFRPELTLFSGYNFQRTSAGVIEVWLPDICSFCAQDVHVCGQFVRIGNLTDLDLQKHGLRLFEGRTPVYAVKPYSGAPLMCDPCQAKWRKGEALELTGEAKERSFSWRN